VARLSYSSIVKRGGSRLEVFAVDDRPKSQTSTATPAEPEELSISLDACWYDERIVISTSFVVPALPWRK